MCLVKRLAGAVFLQDDRVKYVSETGRGKVTKEALLNDSDNLWAEFRHDHIAKVLNDLGEARHFFYSCGISLCDGILEREPEVWVGWVRAWCVELSTPHDALSSS